MRGDRETSFRFDQLNYLTKHLLLRLKNFGMRISEYGFRLPENTPWISSSLRRNPQSKIRNPKFLNPDPFLYFPILFRSALAIDRRVRLLLRLDHARNVVLEFVEDLVIIRVACARKARRVSERRARTCVHLRCRRW